MSYVEGSGLYANPSRLYGPIQQGDWREPVPGWGMNPRWSGPARVGVGTLPAQPETDTQKMLRVGGFYAIVAGIVIGSIWVVTRGAEAALPKRK